MVKHVETGRLGEHLAVEYLGRKNYQIIERNWRFGRSEIDIIAIQGNILVFVEVKTRSYDHFGKPEEFVNSKKETMICDGAAAYMREKAYSWEFRFDIIAVLLTGEQPEIKHFEDAFFPGI